MAFIVRDYKGRRAYIRFERSRRSSRKCTLCGRPVRRSWVTKILHAKCRVCRYLIMMYGPSIHVKR